MARGGKPAEKLRPEDEKKLLVQRLKETDWNISETARSLNIPRSRLYRKTRALRAEPTRGSQWLSSQETGIRSSRTSIGSLSQQPVAPPAQTSPVVPPARRRFVALAWLWTVLAVVLGIALLLWPYEKSCGIRLIFFLGAALLAVILAMLGAFASWTHRQGAAMLLSLIVILWAGIMAAREVLPRTGYAKEAREWTCPASAPAPAPAPAPTSSQ